MLKCPKCGGENFIRRGYQLVAEVVQLDQEGDPIFGSDLPALVPGTFGEVGDVTYECDRAGCDASISPSMRRER